MKPIRLGIIGAGMAFEPHARALQDLSGRVEVLAVAVRSQAQRDAVRTRFSFPTVASVQEVIDHPAIDAVLMLTPPATHPDLVALVAAAGKHILLEKPLALSTPTAGQEALEVQLLSKRSCFPPRLVSLRGRSGAGCRS